MEHSPAALRIGALAHASALSPDTLRHYERLGLLPILPRSRGRFRRYPPAALRRVRVIAGAAPRAGRLVPRRPSRSRAAQRNKHTHNTRRSHA